MAYSINFLTKIREKCHKLLNSKDSLARVFANWQYKEKNYGKELLIVLKVLPIFGPNIRTTTMTTNATRERMIAYSTSP